MSRRLKEEFLAIKGMSCGHCQARVEQALREVPGVSKAEVDLPIGLARVSFDPERTGRAALVRAVERVGYSVGP